MAVRALAIILFCLISTVNAVVIETSTSQSIFETSDGFESTEIFDINSSEIEETIDFDPSSDIFESEEISLTFTVELSATEFLDSSEISETTFLDVTDSIETSETIFIDSTESIETSETTFIDTTDSIEESETTFIDTTDSIEESETTFIDTTDSIETSETTFIDTTDSIEESETTFIDTTESIEESETVFFDASESIEASETLFIDTSDSIEATETVEINLSSDITEILETSILSSVSSTEAETTSSSVQINPTSTITVATSATPIDNGELYPFGAAQGDRSFGSQWPQTSDTLHFRTRVPFGGDGFSIGHVLYNGLISFGPDAGIFYPDLDYAFGRFKRVGAIFWGYFDWYDTNATVYYQVYDRTDNSTSSDEILLRATDDVRDFDTDAATFNATTVLVATWFNVRPVNWYSWICIYYEFFEGTPWFDELYEEFCVDFTDPELNTFQGVYVTDGEAAYLLYLYKRGSMTWRFQRWRRIVIGYANGDELFEFEGLTNTAATTTLDIDVGNTGVAGYYIYKVGQMENPVARCQKFHEDNRDLVQESQYLADVESLYNCPCTLNRLQRHWWWFDFEIDFQTGEETHCYALSTVAKRRLERLFGNTLNKMCCYRFVPPNTFFWRDWFRAWTLSPFISDGPRAGRILRYDPWFWLSTSRQYVTQDVRPHIWCCISSNIQSQTCPLFHEIRFLAGCSTNLVLINGRLLGDPHIKTLDGREYTMNGWGEYILLEIDSEDFMLQGRTERAVGRNGNFTQATVFVAFAARETENATFQAELNSTQDGMILSANGIDITRSFYDNDTFNAIYGDTISITKISTGDRVQAEASFASGTTLKLFPGNQNLEFTVSVTTDMAGLTTGLMGNFNNDSTDEFNTPDGTNLGDSLTERQIFETFAALWQVTSQNTIFTYPVGMTVLNFQHSDFEPLFREEANQTLLALAEDFCGAGNNTCIFDYLATGDESFATTTLQVDQDNQEEDQNLANNPPTVQLSDGQLNANGYFRVDNEETHYITVTGSDSDGDDFTFKLRPHDAGVELTVNSSGIITYIANTSFPVSIQVYTEDSNGAVSNVITIPILGCTGCSGNGVCDSSVTRDEEFLNGGFILHVCNCAPAWTGVNCESDFDACEENPCLELQNCTDLTPAAQGNDAVGYTCGDCPLGYEVMDQVQACVDSNECNETDTCTNADCLNTIGSFTCDCLDGYRVTADDTVCEDMNECVERLHNCPQVCVNTEGGFNCTCYEGWTLNNAGQCEEDPDLSTLCAALSCSDFCVNNSGEAACACPTGYDFIAGNDTHCENIDECNTGVSPCQQVCQDLIGSYNCSCRDGFQLARNGQDCEACEPPYWGANCQSRCACSGRGTCDSQQGCVCSEGWTGENCNTDVNECSENPNACQPDQTCVNTVGSFTCQCNSGYTMDADGDCEDTDECEDVTTHNCDTGLEVCVNNIGSFRCDCQSGFTRDGSGTCVDIDECSQGIHSCAHLCENVPGFYNCRCQFGFRLDSDRESCIQIEDVCASFNRSCEYECTVDTSANTALCICPTGFGLIGETSCEDINECDFDHLNLCDEPNLCQNTNGSFTCSCSSGFRLENDGRSCTACTGGTWGPNCENSCGCTEHASECDTRVGCRCNSGYTGVRCEEDIDECQTGATICSATQVCENIPGTARCVCRDGYVAVDNTTCTDVNECASSNSNDCSQECTNVAGSYICSCFSGYELNGNSCDDVDECNLRLDNCAEICINSEGRFRCDCSNGFELGPDGTSCSASEECGDSHPCDSICAVVDGEETCFCPLGQNLNTTDNQTCYDVDLCATSVCEEGCAEANSNTTIVCSCYVGSQLNSDGYTCSECPDGTYGLECSETCGCISLNTQLCNKTDGTCTCNDGWVGADCSTDIDECLSGTHDCPVTSTCQNTNGSFVCICNDGYFKSGDNCTECADGFFGKDCASRCLCDRGDCNPTNGSCDCDSGWQGVICDVDINECDTEPNDCTLANRTNWVCSNTLGSFECGCASGYDDNGVNCTNIDECSADHLNQCNQQCTDTDGSYICSCNAGYELQGNFTCVDIDECTTLSPCAHLCENSAGSFTCSCNAGASLEDDNTTCFTSYEYQFTVTLDTTVSFTLDPENPLYDVLKDDLERQITVILSETVVNFVRYVIALIRLGSVIVDGTSIVRDLGNHRGTMVEALIALASADITVENRNTTPVIHYNGTEINITSSTDKCAIVAMVNPCPSGSTCVVIGGIADCQEDDDDDDLNIPLIVGLCVGIPVLIIIIVLIVAVFYLKSKNKKLTRVASREGHYNDNISRPPSGHSNGGLLLNEDK